MITFATNVRINRDPQDVFDVIANPLTYPRWHSAVEAVRPLPEGDGRFSMERLLPGGRVHNTLEVVAAAPPEEIIVQALAGPTPFTYRYRLRGENGATDVSLEGEIEIERVPKVLEPAAARVVRRGVDANLVVLRQLLERETRG
jgi:uncharacterized protein YndB with AHSA1/START domain